MIYQGEFKKTKKQKNKTQYDYFVTIAFCYESYLPTVFISYWQFKKLVIFSTYIHRIISLCLYGSIIFSYFDFEEDYETLTGYMFLIIYTSMSYVSWSKEIHVKLL